MAVINGTDGADIIQGTMDEDILYGWGGNDMIAGWHENDIIMGGSGDDILNGEGLNDTVYGGAGNDTIYASYNFDTLYGDEGDDTFLINTEVEWVPLLGNRGSTGTDNFYGGADFDTIIFTGAPATIVTPVIDIGYLDSIELIYNAVPTENVYLYASEYLDVSEVTLIDIKGIQGWDSTDDILIGGVTLDAVTLAPEVLTMEGFGGNDTLYGTWYNDILDGGVGNDTLSGGDGVDKLYGGAGDDVLGGLAGNDELTGGAGADQFAFLGSDGWDKILDFANGVDKLVVGPDILTVNLYNYSGHALLEFEDINGNYSQVELMGVSTAAIDASDLIFV